MLPLNVNCVCMGGLIIFFLLSKKYNTANDETTIKVRVAK